MKHLILLLILLGFTMKPANSQAYVNAAGIKAGYSSGLVFKHFIYRDAALEAQALYNAKGFQLSMLYEYHYSPHPKERLQYFAGGGIHTGNWDGEFALGAAMILGSEFVFRKAPLMLGLEWKPMANIYKETGFALPDIALAAKVLIN